MILDNMGRQKAIAALEIYREHEKFRKQLETMQDAPNDSPAKPTPAAAAATPSESEPVDDGFLQVPAAQEEEKKEKKQPRRRVS